jgi:Tryptophan dimethylallyltransferase
MMSASLSLREYTGGQLRRLCAVVGIPEIDGPMSMLGALLGASAERFLYEPPLWPSDIADDATPVEFSLAFDRKGVPALRLHGETIANTPGIRANACACLSVITSLAEQYTLSLDRFQQIQDLFFPEDPRGDFGMWYSVIFRPRATPDFKVYLNPNAQGRHQAPEVVAEALRRLGLKHAYSVIAEHGAQRWQLDRFSYFALDLHAQPWSRVKVYVAHLGAGPVIAQRAAGAVPGVDPAEVADFCSLVGGDTERFPGRPLMSSFTFTETNPAVPNNYSLYLPIREIVSDDETARQRVRELMIRHGLDASMLDRVLAAVSARPLRNGVGLITYVSLRLGPARPGMTVYLASEAYRTTPPRPRTSPLSLLNIQ